MFWFVLVRAFNYTGHGGGRVKHVDGIDFDRSNLSINQTRPVHYRVSGTTTTIFIQIVPCLVFGFPNRLGVDLYLFDV